MSDDAEPSPRGRSSLFARGEPGLRHAIYGLILTMATLGELLHLDTSEKSSIAWLLGAGTVLFAAHLFSDVLARAAATRDGPNRVEVIDIARENATVTTGALAASAVLAVAGLAGVDDVRSLEFSIVLGLIALVVLSYYATAERPLSTRLTLSVGTAGLGWVIVLLENTV